MILVFISTMLIGGCWRWDVRQSDGENSASPGGVRRPDFASVQLDEVLDNRETQSRPSRARPRLVDPIKALENPREVLGGDAWARIRHVDPGRAVTRHSPKTDVCR